MGTRITALVGPIWSAIPEADARAAERVLNDVLEQLNEALTRAA